MVYKYIIYFLCSLTSFALTANILFAIIRLISNGPKYFLFKNLILLLFAQAITAFIFYLSYKKSESYHIELAKKFFNFIKLHKKWFIFSLSTSLIGSMILMGLPGFILIFFSDGVKTLINLTPSPLKLETFEQKNHGDSYWPTAIALSFIWPWAIFLFYKVFTRFLNISTKTPAILLSILTFFIILLAVL
ncbi:MAG: hypothetical protein ACRBCI_01180 [Cellvibrionaceae bacterium]